MFFGYAGKVIKWFVARTDLVGTSTAHAQLVDKISHLAGSISELQTLREKISALDAQLALSDRHHTLAFWTALDRVYDHILIDRTLSCIVCGHSNKRVGFEILTSQCIFDGGKLERYKCPTCECVFGAQKFLDQPDNMVDLDYRLLYSRYKEGDTANVEIWAFNSLGPERGKSYINWGCGAWNDTVARLRAEHWDVWGYEPSAGLASSLVVGTVDELPSPIAGIFSNNVIEHFLDPVSQFKQFNSLLPIGGRMAHSSPCYEYRYDFTRFHTVFLTGKSPEVLAERTGFRVADRITDGEQINVVYEKVAA